MGFLELDTGNNGTYKANKVLVAAGCFTNHNNLLPRQLDLTYLGWHVGYLELDIKAQKVLSNMPSIIYRTPDPKKRWYFLPPQQYPDGKVYLKFGSTDKSEWPIHSVADVIRCFRSDGSQHVMRQLAVVIKQIFPDITPLNMKIETCVTNNTASGRPYIGVLNDNLYVLVGDNGGAAKYSDELGFIAAQIMTDQCQDDIAEGAFTLSFAD